MIFQDLTPYCGKSLPLRSALLYALLAGLWIIGSDWLLAKITGDLGGATILQTYKGWLFVIVTAIAFYLILRHEVNKLQREIDHRRMIEQSLRENETRLVKAQQLAKMGDFIWDLETGEITWSAGLYDLIRYDKDDTIDFEIVKSNIFHPDDQERVNQWLQDSLTADSDELPPNKYRVRRKDGEIIIILTQGIIERREGRKPRVFAAVMDITEHVRAEREKEKLQLQFVQAQKMESVGRLAGGVAHDFNNILTVIIGYSDFALTKVKPEDPLHDDLTEILAAAKRSTNITRQLLAFARKQAVVPRLLNLNHSIDDTLKMLRRLIGEEIELTWRPGDNLGMVKIDPSQVDQMLANLCVNSRDAINGIGNLIIETGTVTLDDDYCACHEGFSPGDYVMLTVSDNGCGMDQETKDHLFEPFFTTKGEGKGTGLGLATVFGIVKQNNGCINVYSEEGKGTTFKIYLPRHETSAEPKPTAPASVSDTQGNETILVVEDDPAILKLATRVIGQLGYTVLTAATPVAAIAAAQKYEGEIHLLMTDVVMPEMNGRELGELLQKRYPDLAVLFMSGYTATVIANRGVLKEGVNFLSKPFSRQELTAKIREALGS